MFLESCERNGTLRYCAVTQGRRQVYAISDVEYWICANDRYVPKSGRWADTIAKGR
jgi:hypothetical protein